MQPRLKPRRVTAHPITTMRWPSKLNLCSASFATLSFSSLVDCPWAQDLVTLWGSDEGAGFSFFRWEGSVAVHFAFLCDEPRPGQQRHGVIRGSGLGPERQHLPSFEAIGLVNCADLDSHMRNVENEIEASKHFRNILLRTPQLKKRMTTEMIEEDVENVKAGESEGDERNDVKREDADKEQQDTGQETQSKHNEKGYRHTGIRAEALKGCDDETKEMMRCMFFFFNEIIKQQNLTTESVSSWKRVAIKIIYKRVDPTRPEILPSNVRAVDVVQSYVFPPCSTTGCMTRLTDSSVLIMEGFERINR